MKQVVDVFFPILIFGFKEKPCMDVEATRLFEATVIADEGAPVEYKSDDADILAIDDITPRITKNNPAATITGVTGYTGT